MWFYPRGTADGRNSIHLSPPTGMAKRTKRTSGLNFGKAKKGSDESCEAVLSLDQEANFKNGGCDSDPPALSYKQINNESPTRKTGNRKHKISWLYYNNQVTQADRSPVGLSLHSHRRDRPSQSALQLRIR